MTSIAGVQSCGKSTLLNTIFGVNMETSAGCCTRGINLALVRSEGWNAHFDYVMIMDTEGLCNPNFQQEGWYDYHNNWLATVATLAANTCLLMSNNEDDTLVRKVLPFAMLSHFNAADTLEKFGFGQRHLFFIYNRTNPEDAERALFQNRFTLQKMVEEKREELKIHSEPTNGFNPFCLDKKQFYYLGPDLNHPKSYGRNVLKIRDGIANACGLQFSPKSLNGWFSLFSCLLDALRVQDFELSFENFFEIRYD